MSAPVAAQRNKPAQTAKDSAKPPEKTGPWSVLEGIVVDSLHGGVLSGATVLLDGTTISVTTDSQGKFRMDSIVPGDYRIAVFHPLLDTLGFSIGTQPLRMGADSIRQVLLGTPSAATLVKSACTALQVRLGPGAIMGRVLNPDTQEPMDSVRVTLVWTDIQVGKDVGFRRTQKLREAYTNASGSFTLCGVPPGIKGTLEAEHGDAKTAEVPVDMDQVLAMETLYLSPLVAKDSNSLLVGEAIVSGRVVNDKGIPVPDARVSVTGAKSMATTGTDGEFRLTGLPSGTRAVVVRRVGYSPVETAVDLSAREPARIIVRLAQSAPTLQTVSVQGAYQSALKKNGFLDRKKMGMGHFLGPEDIARRQPQYFSSLFQTIPGFRLVNGQYGSSITSSRSTGPNGQGGCVTIWVDGVQYRESQTGELDNQLPVNQLMAVETYSSSEAPMEYQAAGQSSCAVVVVWTNRTVRPDDQGQKQ
jgi:hypothetical protein